MKNPCDIGRIKRVDLREVWKHEASDFSAWMEANLEVLSEAIGIELANPIREMQVGVFSLDLMAEDENGDRIIIENQLGKSDHDHLGKVITYLSGLEAKAAVWVTPDPRPEHVTAVTWLNQSANEDFYLVKVEAIRIGDSMPAPLFTLIVGPSEEAKAIGKEKKRHSEQRTLMERFWRQLLDRFEENTGRPMAVPLGKTNWQKAEGDGACGRFYFTLRQNDGSVEFYIHNPKERGVPQGLYDFFLERRGEIEGAVGEELTWVPPNGRKYGRILLHCLDKGRFAEEEDWPEMHRQLLEAMGRLQAAVSPVLAEAG